MCESRDDLGLRQVNQDGWRPYIPEWRLETADDCPGMVARRLWEERFAEVAERVGQNSEVLFTGIGDPVVLTGEGGAVQLHGDGSEIPPFKQYKEGEAPETLFLVAKTRTLENLNSLVSVAIEYREQGVENIIVVLMGLPHERQDHRFKGKDGRIVSQAMTLKGVIASLAGTGVFDAALGIGMHSLEPVKIAAEDYGFPLLPIDPFDFMVEAAGLRDIPNPFILGPDKGRRNEAERAAALLGSPFEVADKERAREAGGEPTIYIRQAALDYILANSCNVVTLDDESREAGTASGIRQGVSGYTRSFTFVAFKGIFAMDVNKGMTAAQKLATELKTPFDQEVIIVSNAVTPAESVAEIADKLVTVKVEPEVEQMLEQLRREMVNPDDPDWMRKGLLKLDIRAEKVT